MQPGTDVDSWVRRFQGSRSDLSAYQDITLVFRDPDGQLLGQYDLGTRPTR